MGTTKNNKNNTKNNRNNKSVRRPHPKRPDRHADLVDSFQWGFVEGADNETGETHNEFRPQNKTHKKSNMKTAAKNIAAVSPASLASAAAPPSTTGQISNPAQKITPPKHNKNTTTNHPKKKKKKNRQIANPPAIIVTNNTAAANNTNVQQGSRNSGKNTPNQSFEVTAKVPVNKNPNAKNPNSKEPQKNTRRKITNQHNNTTRNINGTKEIDANLLFESFDDENDLNLPSYGRTYRDSNTNLEQETNQIESQIIVTEKHRQQNYQTQHTTKIQSPTTTPQSKSSTPTPTTPSIPTPTPIAPPHSTTRPTPPNSTTSPPTLPQSNFAKPVSYPASSSASVSVAQKITSAPVSTPASNFRNVKSDSGNLHNVNLNADKVDQRISAHETTRPKKEQMVWDPDKREYVPLQIPDQFLPDLLPELQNQPPAKPQRQPITQKQPTTKIDSNINKIASQSELNKSDQPVVNRRSVVAVAVAVGEVAATAEKLDEIADAENQLRSNVQQRGNVPRPVASKRPDPADIEADARGFARLGLSDVMLDALRILRYIEPTPIQSGVFERVKSGKDIMGQAQTGTGKTAAFSIPIIEGIEECPPGDEAVALILVPTRELAVQVRDEIVRLSYGRDIRIAACYGGKPIVKQITKLSGGIDIVVGTPGRVLDLMNRRTLITNSLKWVVLDEADRMLDIGFRPDIEKILKKSPSTRQTLLFSATLPPPVVKLAERYMHEPEILDFSNKHVSVDTIEQFYVTVDHERKFDALVYLLNEERPNQTIIFTRTKRGADRLARLLSKQISSVSAIHGDLLQADRDKIMSKFRAGDLRYLVATDVVGRGIDVSGISHIINYDIPHFCDDYVHRVGRTGRMGREGVAYTFVTAEEGNELTRIEMRIEKLLKRADLKGFESFSKPIQENNNNENQQNHKPVFGKPIRKIRRAL
jgi:ATP-dependent RNA helicase DeaD